MQRQICRTFTSPLTVGHTLQTVRHRGQEHLQSHSLSSEPFTTKRSSERGGTPEPKTHRPQSQDGSFSSPHYSKDEDQNTLQHRRSYCSSSTVARYNIYQENTAPVHPRRPRPGDLVRPVLAPTRVCALPSHILWDSPVTPKGVSLEGKLFL